MAMAHTQTTLTKLGRDQLPAAVVLPDAPVQAVARLPFDRFKRENGSALHTPQREGSSKLGEIMEAWAQFGDGPPNPFPDPEYSKALDAISGICCSAIELQEFISSLIPPMPRHDPPTSLDLVAPVRFKIKAGMFLSALINTGTRDSYTLDMRQLGLALRFLGYRTTKDIVIIGNGDYGTGGMMAGGTIILTGNTGDSVGFGMRGGKIIIRGNCGCDTGQSMEGGEICVHGTCSGVGVVMFGGKIIVGGVQVYPQTTIPSMASHF